MLGLNHSKEQIGMHLSNKLVFLYFWKVEVGGTSESPSLYSILGD